VSKYSVHSMSKRCVRTRKLITRRPAVGVPVWPVEQTAPPVLNSLAGLRPRMTGRKGPVTRPKGGASVLRTGGRPHRSQAPSPHAPRGRPGGKKCDRVTAGIIGGGVTGKATRPTGVLTLRVKRSGRRHSFQTFLPPPAKNGALRATRSLTARINTRRSPAFSASLSAVRCCPAGAVSSSACPGLTPRLCGVAFGHSPRVLGEHTTPHVGECRPTKALFRSIPQCVTWLGQPRQD
jgi:hypothetical protein